MAIGGFKIVNKSNVEVKVSGYKIVMIIIISYKRTKGKSRHVGKSALISAIHTFTLDWPSPPLSICWDTSPALDNPPQH